MGTYRIVDRKSGKVVCEAQDRWASMMFTSMHGDEFRCVEVAVSGAVLWCGPCHFAEGGRVSEFSSEEAKVLGGGEYEILRSTSE